MAAYIDLNPVRAGIVDDPKDYRFCGYAEAVAGASQSIQGLLRIWADYLGGDHSPASILKAHRSLIFGMGSNPWEVKGCVIDRKTACRVIEVEDGVLPTAAALRCRVRYFTDGAVLGSADYVRGFTDQIQLARKRMFPLKANPLKGADWGDIAVLQSLRRDVFS